MRRADHAAAWAAALALAVGMGFGRFAFTGLYPRMVADHLITVAAGSYAASANYAGYLVGALLAGRVTHWRGRRLFAVALGTGVALMGALALPLTQGLIVAIRGLAGVSSALAMVAASHWLFHDRQQRHSAPALFAGVGIGIALSAEMIAGASRLALSAGAIWLVLACGALLLAGAALGLQASAEHRAPPPAAPEAPAPSSTPLGSGRLLLVYGLAGFGYIVTATYLPLLVRGAAPAMDPVHVWAAFGLGAAPSCFVWHGLHMRWGARRSLAANLALQAAGVALPLLHTPAAYGASGLLVGATFMGTVTIAMPLARHMTASLPLNPMAAMTLSYGLGQICGPMIAAHIYARTHAFDGALLAATGALIAAAGLVAIRTGRADRAKSSGTR